MNSIEELLTFIVDKVKAYKKTSRLYEGFDKDMEYYLHVIARINSLPRNAASIDGIPLEKIAIISDLKDLVMPNSITISGKDRERDFIVRDVVDDNTIIDLDRMKDIVAAFYSMFKMDVVEANVKEARIDEALSADDFAKNCSFNGMCVTDEPVRYPVDVDIKVYKDSKYFHDVVEVKREYLDKQFRKLRK